MRLYIDLETYSPEPLADCGLYRYAMHPDFDILLLAYAIDEHAPVGIVDLASGEKLPTFIIDALLDKDIVKVAHNAAFERVCLSMYFRKHGLFPNQFQQWLDPRQWHCTSIQASRCGLPMSLAEAGAALGLERQKMSEGKSLIRTFCVPHKGKGGLYGQTERVMPEDRPEDWQTFKDYCVRDVDVERQIDLATDWYQVSDTERELYAVDQIINDWGVKIDVQLATNAVRIGAIVNARLNEEAMKITGLSNPNSVSQLKGWLSETAGIDLDSLTKKDLPEIRKATGDPRVHRVLDIRAQLGKASNAKYEAMLGCVCPDGRVHGLLQFYGSRTGRWAGRLVQVQNLPQNHIEDLELARELLSNGDLDGIELCYGNVPDTLSQLIRTAFICEKGNILAVCDFSAIEARVLAWLAGEDWVLDVFRKGGDIYCATATQMFHVPVEKHGQNKELRQKGKIAVLALGYGGAVNALDAMGGKRMGMSEEDEKETVTKWRKANPRIVAFWKDVENAVRRTVAFKVRSTVRGIEFNLHDDTLCCVLPSGRTICYPEMRIVYDNDWAYLDQTDAQRATNPNYIVREKKTLHPDKYWDEPGSRLAYKGVVQTTNKWTWIDTFGGKLVENITQAVARDCLAHAMLLVMHENIPIVFHVHDELVCEVPDKSYLEKIEKCFSKAPDWAQGLPLKGAGYVTPFYKKD